MADKHDPLGNPFAADVSLSGHSGCCHPEADHRHSHDDRCRDGHSHSHGPDHPRQQALSEDADRSAAALSQEDLIDRAVESAVVRAVFGHDDVRRRAFLRLVGQGTAAAALSAFFPLAACKEAVKEQLPKETAAGDGVAKSKLSLEKTKLKVGFVPITCATPIIMAHPLGFYKKYGLDVDVIKTAGWAVARDKSISREYDASHMLTPHV